MHRHTIVTLALMGCWVLGTGEARAVPSYIPETEDQETYFFEGAEYDPLETPLGPGYNIDMEVDGECELDHCDGLITRLEVAEVLCGTEADTQNVHVGDMVISIDGVYVVGISPDALMAYHTRLWKKKTVGVVLIKMREKRLVQVTLPVRPHLAPRMCGIPR